MKLIGFHEGAAWQLESTVDRYSQDSPPVIDLWVSEGESRRLTQKPEVGAFLDPCQAEQLGRHLIACADRVRQIMREREVVS